MIEPDLPIPFLVNKERVKIAFVLWATISDKRGIKRVSDDLVTQVSSCLYIYIVQH